MSTFSISMCFKSLLLITLYLGAISAEKDSIFKFRSFGKRSNFHSKLAFFGDSKVVNGSSAIQISGFSNSSVGRVFYKTPIKLIEDKPNKRGVSFSTRFVFSISSGIGDGLAFVMVPIGYPLDSFDRGSFGLLNSNKFSTLSVEFDTKMDKKFGDLNANHVRVNVNVNVNVKSSFSVKTSNVSKVKSVLSNGENLVAWIDYEASSKRMEVRLSKLGETKPINPLLSCLVDVSDMWKEEEVFIGLSSSNGDSSQKCELYSWELKIRQVPRWVHSQPMDPDAFSKNMKAQAQEVPKERDCHLKILGALIFGLSGGALGTLVGLFIWSVFVSKRPVVPEEFVSKSVEFEPEKLKVVVLKPIESGKK